MIIYAIHVIIHVIHALEALIVNVYLANHQKSYLMVNVLQHALTVSIFLYFLHANHAILIA